ncbi:uncharacterized protein LOC115734627, partial [Rhodamnia argentea]|uniref:Uncharacterized protein LOC115734627 n=1 Tax=Rhodamnia argentea TaxID=178133 RepID=A0ABM3HPS3_9MYRT
PGRSVILRPSGSAPSEPSKRLALGAVRRGNPVTETPFSDSYDSRFENRGVLRLVVTVAATGTGSEGASAEEQGQLPMVGAPYSQKWGYIRIITGTILGGVLGFYVMHRVEISYKEKMKERLRQYEMEMKKKQQQQTMTELEDSA